MKNKANTVKQILAKVMLFVMLVVYLLNLSACRDPLSDSVLPFF